jgi:hypothetical protein
MRGSSGSQYFMSLLHHLPIPRVIGIQVRGHDIFGWIGEQMPLDDVILAAVPDMIEAAVSNPLHIGQVEWNDMGIGPAADDVANPIQRRWGDLRVSNDQPSEVLPGLRAQ